MYFENMNIKTFLLVIFWLLIVWYVFYINYKIYKKNKKHYSWLFIESFNKYIFLAIAVILLLFWIFQLKWGEVKHKINAKWVDMEFVLDVSKSMNTIDIKYLTNITTRLNFVKKAISNYVAKNPNNRYWLTIFSKNPIWILPLTSDSNIFLTMLDGVDYKNLTKQWSDFSSAIRFWINRFTDKKRPKVLVFVSDGWDDGDYKWLNFKVPNDIKFVVVWVWTKRWWKIYLGQDEFWDINYQIYNWQYVITKINEKNLKNIANDLKAKYFHLSNIQDIYKLNDYLKNIQKKALNWSLITDKEDFTRYIVILAFMMFLIYLFLEIKK